MSTNHGIASAAILRYLAASPAPRTTEDIHARLQQDAHDVGLSRTYTLLTRLHRAELIDFAPIPHEQAALALERAAIMLAAENEEVDPADLPGEPIRYILTPRGQRHLGIALT